MRSKKLSRIYAYVPETVNQEIAKTADQLGVTKSVLISLAVQAGLKHVAGAIDPSKAFSLDEWAEITRKMVDKQEGVK